VGWQKLNAMGLQAVQGEHSEAESPRAPQSGGQTHFSMKYGIFKGHIDSKTPSNLRKSLSFFTTL
jgi:hypothetical protein